MKTAKKALILLMVGLLLVSSLVACGGKESSDNSNKSEESKFDQYKKLSPEEIYDILLEADEYTIRTTISLSKSNQLMQEITYAMEKDNNKLKALIDTKSSDGTTNNRISYCDLENNYIYTQYNDEWQIDTDDTDLAEVLEELTPKDLLFKKENYGEPDQFKTKYPLLADAIASEFGEEGLTCSGSMTRNGTTYTFVINASKDDKSQDINIVIEFKDVSITLPEAKAPSTQQGSETAIAAQVTSKA